MGGGITNLGIACSTHDFALCLLWAPLAVPSGTLDEGVPASSCRGQREGLPSMSTLRLLVSNASQRFQAHSPV
jgi:hypothetical protein